MKHLYENLRVCAKEEEVKAAFCKFFSYLRYYMLNAAVTMEAYDSAAEANSMVEDGSVTNDPVFNIAGTQLNNRNATQDDIWLSLAKHVPAVSSPVGKMTIFDGTDFDLNDGNVIGLPNGWGRSGNVYGQSWLHSDMKDMAYFYVFSLYTEFVTKGMLR